MSTQVEMTSTAEYRQVAIDLDVCRPEYQHSTQSSGVGGISFSPLHLLKLTGLVTGIAVIGTIPLPVENPDLTSGDIEVSFLVPSTSEPTVEDEYSRIRAEIVASGLPMLSDDEVRAEIRDRRGSRGGTES